MTFRLNGAEWRGRVASFLLAAVFAGWAFWISSQYLAYGHYSYYRQHDTAEANGAFYAGQSEYARRDLLGYWTPSAASGVDARSNGKGGQPLFEALSQYAQHWWLPGLFLCLEAFVAGFSTASLLRARLGVSIAPAVVAGLSASQLFGGNGAYSGFFLGSGCIVPCLPLFLIGLMWAGDQKTPVAVASAAALGVALQLSSGVTLAAAALPLAACWMFAVEPHRTSRHALVIAVCAMAFLVTAAPALGAMAMNSAESHRTLWPIVPFGLADEAAAWAAREWEAVALLRVNAVFLIPAAIGWLAGGFRRRSLSTLLALSVAIILEVYLMVPIRGAIKWVYPPFSTFQVDRLTQFVPFLSAAAGALGIHHISTLFAARRARVARWVGAVAVILTCGAIAGVVVERWQRVNDERESLRQLGSNYASLFERPGA